MGKDNQLDTHVEMTLMSELPDKYFTILIIKMGKIRGNALERWNVSRKA